MFIKRIKLKNFKSFRKAEIVFKDNFTVITGPNGSGKSNIIDSILFCFGLTSSKTLRADKLTDLIKHGQKECEVEIELDSCTVKRRIRETNKGYYSYYYVNDKSVSYSEIEKLVEKLGLNAEYSIVMQGDVTRIAEMTPLQRRKIIEDVAGISEFEEKKEKALEELEEVKNNIEKVEITLREVEDRLSKLKVEREEALRYRELIKEKEKLEYFRKVHEYLKLSNTLKDLNNKLERWNFERDEILKRITSINSELLKLSGEAEEIITKIESFKDSELKRLNDEINRVTGEINSLKKLIDVHRSEIKDLKAEKDKILLSIESVKEEIERLENDLKEVDIELGNVGKVLEEKINLLNSLKAEYDEIYSKQGFQRKELEEKIKILESLKEKRTALLKEREKILEGLRRIESEIEDLELSKDKINLNKLFDEILEDEKKLAVLKNDVEKLKLRIFDLDGDIFKIRDELSRIDKEIREKEIELAKASVARPKAVEIVLKAKEEGKLEGIYGTVSQLCRVDEKVSLALEIAGGNALNFIVVEDEECAIKAVKYLKEVEGGRASFIPLNRINVRINLDKSVFGLDGVVDYAVNLIECDEKFRKVFELIYKDTLVVRDIDTARMFINRFRVVTLDGDLIDKSGIITGGHVKKKALGLFESGLKNEVEELKRRKDELELRLSELEGERRRLQEELERLTLELANTKSRLSANRQRVSEFGALLNDVERKLSEKRSEMKNLNTRATKMEEEISKVEKEIEAVESEVRKIEHVLKDDSLSELSRRLEEVREEIERLKDLKSNLSSKRSSLIAKRDQIMKSLREYEKNLESIEDKISERIKKIEEAENNIRELEKVVDELKKEEMKINEEVGRLRKKRDLILKKINDLEREKADRVLMEKILKEKIENVREKIAEVERRLELYDVEVPENIPPLEYVTRRILEVDEELKRFGEVNMKAIQEYEEVKERFEDLKNKKATLERERSKIIEKIKEIEKMKKSAFLSTFNSINEKFKEIVRELADGEGEIYLDKDDPFQSGLHIRFKPFGKPIQRLEAMSGGEKSLLTLAFIFAIQRFKPAPFYAFDEVDMFLDGVNVGRLAKMIKRLSKDAQFIVISLRKPMLENADHIIGITRGGDGESMVTMIQLK